MRAKVKVPVVKALEQALVLAPELGKVVVKLPHLLTFCCPLLGLQP